MEHQTYDYDDATKELMMHLGLFIAAYGHFEFSLLNVFRLYSGISHDIHMVLTAGMRTGDVFEKLKRVIQVRKLDPRILTDIEDIEKKLGATKLADFRNNVVHRTWGFSDHGAVITNRATAKAPHLIQTETITSENLKDRTEETMRFTQRVLVHLSTAEGIEHLPTWAREAHLKQAPWLQKPDKQAGPG